MRIQRRLSRVLCKKMESYSNLTPQRKEEIKQEQKGVCAICFADTEPLVIDHEHETDFVRQALCGNCNKGLGFFGDDWDTLLRAACYVIVHKAGLTDLRIGYKLLFEEARKQEARQMANIKRKATEQLCQAKQWLANQEPVAAEETTPTAEPVGLETFMPKDSVHLKKA